MARDPDTRSRRRQSRRLRSRKHNPDGTMSLRDHLREFRSRLAWALLAITLGGIFGFIWFGTRIGPIPSLGTIMTDPYCSLDLSALSSQDGAGDSCKLLQTGPFDAFILRLKIGVAAGAVLTSPAWLYQVWAFVTPGLHTRERTFARTFVAVASLLFTAGAVLAYFVVPAGLDVLVSFGDGTFTPFFRGSEYINFVLVLLLVFGVSFDLPLLIVMLNRAGVLPYDNLKRWRRGIIFGIFVFAAFVTPADPISMIVLSCAMTLLFEAAIQVSRVHERRKARRAAADPVEGLDPDEPTPTEVIAGEHQADRAERGSRTDDVT